MLARDWLKSHPIHITANHFNETDHLFSTKVHSFSCKVHDFPPKVPLFLRDMLATLLIAKHHRPTLWDTHVFFFDKTKAALRKLIKVHLFKQ